VPARRPSPVLQQILSRLAEQMLIEEMPLKTKRRSHAQHGRADNGTARSRP
jgi:hypothetical protein